MFHCITRNSSMTKTLTTCYFAFSFRLSSIQLKKCVENVPALMTLFTRLSFCMDVGLCLYSCVCIENVGFAAIFRYTGVFLWIDVCVYVSVLVRVGVWAFRTFANVTAKVMKCTNEMKTNLSEGNQLINCVQSEQTCYFCRFTRTLSRRISSSIAIDFSWIKVLRLKQNRLNS